MLYTAGGFPPMLKTTGLCISAFRHVRISSCPILNLHAMSTPQRRRSLRLSALPPRTPDKAQSVVSLKDTNVLQSIGNTPGSRKRKVRNWGAHLMRVMFRLVYLLRHPCLLPVSIQSTNTFGLWSIVRLLAPILRTLECVLQ